MTDEKHEINVMQEASEAAAKRQPLAITISTGKSVNIKSLTWDNFNSLWGELSEVIALFIQQHSGIADVGGALKAGIAARFKTAPNLVKTLVAEGSDADITELSNDFQDVFLVGMGVVDYNFIQRMDLLSFFGVAMNACPVDTTAPANEGEPPSSNDT